MWTLLRTLVVNAFEAAVVDFVADQAGRHFIKRFAAAAEVYTMPVADMKHQVPPERRFDLSAFACFARLRWSPLTPQPRPHRLKLRPRPVHGSFLRKPRNHRAEPAKSFCSDVSAGLCD